MSDGTRHALTTTWAALGGAPDWPGRANIVGEGRLPSAFPVTDLAGASVGAAALAIAELIAAHGGGTRGGATPEVTVDRRLASFWFARSIRPLGWDMAAPWDAIAGDYPAADGWIKLHTNAPHHRTAALAVLGVPDADKAGSRGDVARADVKQAVAGWAADDLEAAIVERGGAAAAMRDMAAWAAHPQGRAVAAEPLVIVEPGGEGPASGRSDSGWRPSPARPLRGIRVLDMTRVLAGPVATRVLAGFGADVLRIDPPVWDEPGVVPDVTLGKRCARLDLRRADDRALWEALLARADVIVHGYRPGALAGLGLDAGRRAALRPGLVDVSLCAYGWSGPWAGRRGFDSLVQMSAGIAEAGMRAAGRDQPTPLPVQALDHATGYLMAAAAIRGLTARSGEGRGTVARLSLARTAALLTGLGSCNPVSEELAPESADDVAPAIEATSWGPARRLKPPCAVAGAPMAWDLPATALGSARAGWAGGV